MHGPPLPGSPRKACLLVHGSTCNESPTDGAARSTPRPSHHTHHHQSVRCRVVWHRTGWSLAHTGTGRPLVSVPCHSSPGVTALLRPPPPSCSLWASAAAATTALAHCVCTLVLCLLPQLTTTYAGNDSPLHPPTIRALCVGCHPLLLSVQTARVHMYCCPLPVVAGRGALHTHVFGPNRKRVECQ